MELLQTLALIATIALAVIAVFTAVVFVAMYAAGLGSKIDALGEIMRDAAKTIAALDGSVSRLEGRVDDISGNGRKSDG